MSRGNLKLWFMAMRPKTLPAGIVPVGVGTAMAYAHGYFEWHLSVIALVCAVLIQVITNYLNEVYDFYRGADTKERVGPQRIVADGIVSPRVMLTVSIVLILITFDLGMVLVMKAGIPIFVAGVVSLFFAYAYTGGPYPLAYKGLGDIFVLVFFGIVAVCGTYYVQTLEFNIEVFIAGLGPGFLSMNILGVNNIRDIHTDEKVGKLTLAVRIGEKKAKVLYYFLNALAFIVPAALAYMFSSLWMLLPIAALPYSVYVCVQLSRGQGSELNSVLAATGKLLLLHGLLTSVGFILIAP